MAHNTQLMQYQATLNEIDYTDQGSAIIEALNNFLIERYCLYYNKGYKIFKYGDIYTLYLNMNNQDRPIITSGEFPNDEAFTEYVIKDMDRRGLFMNRYFEIYRADDDCNV